MSVLSGGLNEDCRPAWTVLASEHAITATTVTSSRLDIFDSPVALSGLVAGLKTRSDTSFSTKQLEIATKIVV